MSERIISTATEEKAILGKVGARFISAEAKRSLYAFRLQQHIANKLIFSDLWRYPSALIAVMKRLGLADDPTCQKYIAKME